MRKHFHSRLKLPQKRLSCDINNKNLFATIQTRLLWYNNSNIYSRMPWKQKKSILSLILLLSAFFPIAAQSLGDKVYKEVTVDGKKSKQVGNIWFYYELWRKRKRNSRKEYLARRIWILEWIRLQWKYNT